MTEGKEKADKGRVHLCRGDHCGQLGLNPTEDPQEAVWNMP